MKKYHIGKNGPALCKATKRACRYGDNETHYNDMSAATLAYEKSLEKSFKNTHTLSKTKNHNTYEKEVSEIQKLLKSLNSAEKIVPGASLGLRDTMRNQKLVMIGEKIDELALKMGAPTDEEISMGVAKHIVDRADKIEELVKKKNIAIKQYKDSEPDSNKNIEAKNNYIESVNNLNNEKKKQNLENFADGSVHLHPESASFYKKRGDKIREALKEIGVTFAKPNSLLVHEKSSPKAIKVLNEAISYYPEKWVEESNKASKRGVVFIAKISKKRAHYKWGKLQEEIKVLDEINLTRHEASYVPDPNDPYSIGSHRLEGDTYEYKDSKGNIIYSKKHHDYYGDAGEESVVWAYRNNQVIEVANDDKSLKPFGKNWEQYKMKERYYDYVTSEFKTSEKDVVYWVRPIKERRTIGGEYIHELTINEIGDYAGHSEPGTRVAIHELAHRMETVMPELTRIERSFLKQRAGNNPKLETVNGRSKELGYRDSFPNHYMGRVYDNNHREILSMGMETLFSGTNGGFAGSHNYKEDKEYKHFIIGLLASTVND